MSRASGSSESFPEAAKRELMNVQQRRNLDHATHTIREKRLGVVEELDDWEALRDAAQAIRQQTLVSLDGYLEQFEQAFVAAGGTVHWARDATEANTITASIIHSHDATEVVKVKSLTTDEIGLNEALALEGIDALETDFAELILQLDDDWPSHILVPAIHRNRTEIRDLFRRTIADADLSDQPTDLAEAARSFLRERFLRARIGISGANFAVAETGSLVVLESEGNGRMCTTIPDVLISIVGIEKILPRWEDLEVMLQVLPRSSTAERMNPYTSIWTGPTDGDGPSEMHVILLDAGRTNALADPIGRQALQCIRCSACLNVCPVYERTGGHAYGSIYPGPIGAILTPQLEGIDKAPSLPFASSLCGACEDVCPVKIEIPRLLVHLRGASAKPGGERRAFAALAWVFASRRRYERVQRLGRLAPLIRGSGPLRGWTQSREVPDVPRHTFREWWSENRS